jgi:hypothetical protein
MPAPREINPRRAAIARRLRKQQAGQPQQRPVFRSGVDIDAVHFRAWRRAAPLAANVTDKDAA